MTTPLPGGTLTLGGDLTITRMGYGAMQFGQHGIAGPPENLDEAAKVLHEVVALGITHIDTAGFYGAGGVNHLIKTALHPYREGLQIATKVGFRADDEGNWGPAQDPADIKQQVYENLEQLGLGTLDLVNLRCLADSLDAVSDGPLSEQFGALAELQQQGLIRHLGLSTVSERALAEAQRIAPVVCVQNYYNLAHRADDALVDRCAAEGIAFVPYFPLGGFSPLQSQTLTEVAATVGASHQQVALAWLLQRSTTMALIPGTSSIAHLRDNLAAASLELPADAVAKLDAIATATD